MPERARIRQRHQPCPDMLQPYSVLDSAAAAALVRSGSLVAGAAVVVGGWRGTTCIAARQLPQAAPLLPSSRCTQKTMLFVTVQNGLYISAQIGAAAADIGMVAKLMGCSGAVRGAAADHAIVCEL